ncbi:hypothetical protein C772_00762 [Bhargavaea cecembensis DSE10]|uniref:Uncharacterized protein n=1 Tax=Bhargavaea cecembensis DSE10 TaxID=1235279 RepID=M7NIP5_9BACL|nr:hypothetical protein [Bhargavaea cecembensis]EMR07117.1 hypothetical protein C772_00762 [Bhargavaea cecembensis DSE10]
MSLGKLVRFPLLLFVTACIWQAVAPGEIRFADNLGVSLVAFAMMAIWEWAKKPGPWGQSRQS